jgi:hypothetical protein
MCARAGSRAGWAGRAGRRTAGARARAEAPRQGRPTPVRACRGGRASAHTAMRGALFRTLVPSGSPDTRPGQSGGAKKMDPVARQIAGYDATLRKTGRGGAEGRRQRPRGAPAGRAGPVAAAAVRAPPPSAPPAAPARCPAVDAIQRLQELKPQVQEVCGAAAPAGRRQRCSAPPPFHHALQLRACQPHASPQTPPPGAAPGHGAPR